VPAPPLSSCWRFPCSPLASPPAAARPRSSALRPGLEQVPLTITTTAGYRGRQGRLAALEFVGARPARAPTRPPIKDPDWEAGWGRGCDGLRLTRRLGRAHGNHGNFANAFTWWNGASWGTRSSRAATARKSAATRPAMSISASQGSGAPLGDLRGDNDGSRVPPGWNAWLRGTIDELPEKACRRAASSSRSRSPI
jgi:NADH:ubiquinone oxidoreductase subunit